MLSTFAVIMPVFALILAGWFARRIDVLRDQAAAEL
ncbi:MAG: AEC family transporter, partial [Sphingomonadales bacterium]